VRSLPTSDASILEEAASVAGRDGGRRRSGSAMFSLLGHKGDLMFVHFREDFAACSRRSRRFAKLRLSDYLETTTSYLSVVELGLYESTQKVYASLAERGIEPFSEEWNKAIEETLNRTARSDEDALVAGDPGESVLVFLSDGPAARGT
jgi:peroxiredoxin